ncbi:hypothetical protein B9Z19DRAFT_1128511 [Tuber borchii]|uniref:Aconitase/3-isopropylmalate dehydratase large subunit alpha/beta/alpha domain-containing protein n=1 Tax=Tuber borchii TaxID=42251 RepID=A0A2T6ZP38_TUBBO|nr:hypothetical protein B9Z19DRAFT_1128511 [Tuber borchii]
MHLVCDLPQGRISGSQHTEFYPRISSQFKSPTHFSLIQSYVDTSSSLSTLQNLTKKIVQRHSKIEEVAKRMGVDLCGAGRGIGHQILVEEGYTWPVTLTVARDSHSNIGDLGHLANMAGDSSSSLDGGQRCSTKGGYWKGCNYVNLSLCGHFNNDEVRNHAIEFAGSEQTLEWLKIDDSLTIANMTTKWGALRGVFPIDNELKDWMLQKAFHSCPTT